MDHPPNTLLVIDDQEPQRKPFRGVGTSPSGDEIVRIVEAASGEEGLAIFQSRNDIGYVVCDVHMEGIDGFTTIKRMAEHDYKKFQRATVFMMCTETCEHGPSNASTHTHTHTHTRENWLLKPVNPALFSRLLLKDYNTKMQTFRNSNDVGDEVADNPRDPENISE